MRAPLFAWFRSISLALGVATLAGPAMAFDTLASDFAFSNLQRKLLDDRTAQAAPGDLGAPDAVAAVRFTSDPARTRENLQSFLDQTPGAQAKADMQRLIQLQPPILQQVGAVMKSRYDLDANNFADVYTVWWISAWQAAENQTGDPDRATAQAVSAQVHAALLETPDFLAMKDAQRQKAAEALLLQALLMSEAALAAKGDPALQSTIAQAVTRSALQNGVDLASVRLTSQGFELR